MQNDLAVLEGEPPVRSLDRLTLLHDNEATHSIFRQQISRSPAATLIMLLLVKI